MAGAAGGFLTRSFEIMLKDCGGKKYGALQKAIQAFLDSSRVVVEKPATLDGLSSESGLSSEQSSSGESTSNEQRTSSAGNAETITSVLASVGHTLEGVQAELVFEPLRLALETRNVKLVESALDCLHKLIAYDHLEGDLGLEGGKNSQTFTDILNMVCSSVDNSSPDSTVLQVLKVLLTAVASAKFRVHGEPLLGVLRICYNIALNSKNHINQATSKAMLTQMISIVFRRMESDQASDRSAECSLVDSSSSSEKSNNGENSGEEQGEKKLTLGDALAMTVGSDVSIASVEELQTLAGGADIKGLEAVLDKAVNLEDGRKVSRGIDLEVVSVAQRDALLLFRTLCKMGMKEETDEVTVKTRLLSLELLQGLLEGVSHSFTRNFHFIDSVKAYLSYVLLRASVSPSSAVFQISTGIFSVLLLRFRESLKGEIGVFFPIIILRFLDSNDSPLNHRISVLRMLEKVFKDPQMLSDIFLNYDCDLDSPNLFERTINALSRISQGSMTSDQSTTSGPQTATVKSSSLQCLVNVLKSLIDWEKKHRESEKYTISMPESSDDGQIDNSIDTTGLKREDGPGQFEKAKAHKSTMELAISEFNRKPGKGIDFLLSNNLVENTPLAIAHFLRSTSNLDKAMIGEYLGQHEEFPVAVMHAYVESMKFSGLKFVPAIREFLQGFRLPGEAQKIDRIMEKFAERYCADNLGVFKSADAAYVLAYAVIMLNTDAHNPLISSKMSKSDFVRLNSGGDAEESVSKDILEEIYDSIIHEEIKIKDGESSLDRSARQKAGAEDRRQLVRILNLALPRRKSASDAKAESERIVKHTQALFKRKGAKRGLFHTADQVELVRPMLESVGWPLLAAFSVIMEEGDNKARVLLCMEGFKCIIHFTRVLGMDTMRYAFLTSLVRFTFLHAPKDLHSKNVEALRMLLLLCEVETDSLQDTWNAVLECVSRLEFIISTPSISATVMHGSNQISRDSVLQSLRELAGKPSEQVFVNSVKLPSDSIVEFFTALCGVSAEELKQVPARVFSLQKLVEISYYNMARIRLVWARIWSVLAHHFIIAGSHREEKVAMYAIDSLRQLGMKYLERAELTNFTFQNDILKPFVVLMRNSQSERIRSLIVDCIVQMIKSKVGSIKSGWRSVFMIFTAAANDDNESIVDGAFENVEQVILEHFDQVVSDCFMDCVNCLIGFANNKCSPRISLKAIALLRICEDRLAEGLIPDSALKQVDSRLNSNFDMTEHYWFPMLAGLSDLTLDYRSEVRNCALEVLFDLLNERGHKFSAAFWENIFYRVLFPIFDHVRHTGTDGLLSPREDWLRETSIHSLQLLCNLFSSFYKEVSFMLPPLLGLLLDCAKKTDQAVVSISLGALVHLIEVGGHQFSDADWDTLLKSIRDACFTTQPLELLNSLGFKGTSNQLTLSTEGNAHGESNLTKDESDHAGGPGVLKDDRQGMKSSPATESEGSPLSSVRTPKGSESENFQRSQTFGQRIIGNMMDNLLVRSLTSKTKSSVSDSTLPSSPTKQPQIPMVIEPGIEEEESPTLQNIRGKCMTQLLLLGTLDSIQKKYWIKLRTAQKIDIMDVVLSLLEFAATYNSYSSLRGRMHVTPVDRPPLNLLRQEITGTSIYLDILHKSTSIEEEVPVDGDLENVAEDKLVSFCGQVLKDAANVQSSSAEAANVEAHRALELRAPVIIKVLKGMSTMNSQIFRRHLKEFYPLLTKLVNCNQMDVRRALGDLFGAQLTPLLP